MSGGRGKGGLSAPLLGCAQFTPRGYLCQDEGAGSCFDPVQHGCWIMGFPARGQGGAGDHEDRQAKGARGDQLGLGAAAACVFANDQLYFMGAQEGLICCGREGSATQEDMVIGQGRGRLWRIDQAQDIVMLGLGRESGQVHSPKRQQDAPGRGGEGRDCGGNICDIVPAIPRLGLPGRAGERKKRGVCLVGGTYRIRADLRGKGMGGIHQMRDGMAAQIFRQPRRAAKAAHAHRHGLGFGPLHAPRIAERAGQPRLRQQCHKAAGLDRAAKDKDIGHG